VGQQRRSAPREGWRVIAVVAWFVCQAVESLADIFSDIGIWSLLGVNAQINDVRLAVGPDDLMWRRPEIPKLGDKMTPIPETVRSVLQQLVRPIRASLVQ
jgi:hypothetical protein